MKPEVLLVEPMMASVEEQLDARSTSIASRAQRIGKRSSPRSRGASGRRRYLG